MTTNSVQPLLPLHDVLAQLTGRAVETFSLWADANQKVVRGLVDLSAGTAKEGVRLYAEIQSAAVEAMKEGQTYLLRRQDELQEAPRDPLSTLRASMESARRTFTLLEGTAQAVSRSAERLQAAAEQTGQEIQATWTHFAGQVQTLYTPLA